MIKKMSYILMLIFLSVLISGCSSFFSPSSENNNSLKIISWNLQTFFDPISHGTEYSEFSGNKSTWNEDKYQDRLSTLCDFIEKHNADIYAFTELENANILQDISNNLETKSIFGSEYKYACFGKNPNGVFGCGVISKYPLKNLKLHNIDFSQKETQPELRPIVEISISGKIKDFSLFVCHWKSKSGGAEKTEIWRDLQENLLASAIEKTSNKDVIICGDFNRDLHEFTKSTKSNSIIFKSFSGTPIIMSNPWFTSQEKGSYNFNGEWNKIDHFFISEKGIIHSFNTISQFTNEKGLPIKYSVRTGNGYSDHLPIVCTFEFSE